MNPERETPDETDAANDRQFARSVWSANRILITILMIVGFVATFVVTYLAPALESVNFMGWPLPFYMAAQGSILIYVAIVTIYALVMRWLESRRPRRGRP